MGNESDADFETPPAGEQQQPPKVTPPAAKKTASIPEVTRLVKELEGMLSVLESEHPTNNNIKKATANFRVFRTKIKEFFGQNPGRAA